MDSKPSTTRAMLQRVVNLTKHAHDLQSSANLTVPTWGKNWNRQASTNSEIGQGLLTAANNQSPRTSTYALGPNRKFDFARAQKLLQLELTRRCTRISKTVHYEPKRCLDLVRDFSQQLRRVLKPDTLNNLRYRIIVLVTIVQATPDRQIHQSMAIASRCLWDRETDGSVTAQATLGYDMLAIATAFAVYAD